MADRRAVRPRRQERAREVVHAAVAERRADRDERGEIRVLRAESVGDPRAHRRADERVAARVDLEQRAAVRGVRPVQALDEAEVVDELGDVREQVAHPRARLAVLAELPRAGEQVAGLGELHARLGERQRLARVAREQRLVVERVDLRRPAVHEAEDHPLGAWLEVRRGEHAAVGLRELRQQARERDRAKARAKAGERVAVIEAMKMEATITANTAGIVRRLAITKTQSVESGDLILVVEAQ